MLTSEPQQLTARESVLMEYEAEQNKLAREFEITMKRLDIEAQTLETKWRSWLRIPITIVKLPLFLVLGIGYVVAVARGKEPSQNFWELLK